LNLHPSLLPKYRGPSPLESALLSDDTETGVSIMELDAEVDHGPILIQDTIPLTKTMDIDTLTMQSAQVGIALLYDAIEHYISGDKVPTPQDHTAATKTHKYSKADGLLDLNASDWEKWKVFRALGDRRWVHFTAIRNDNEITVKVTKASFVNDTFVIEEVIPENGKRQSFEVFKQSLL
jgi:methionyl-tRNA formyltransferase